LIRCFLAVAFLLLLAGCTSGATLAPLSPDATVLCFGDSLTYGTGAEAGSSYPDELAKLINRRVVNVGIPGETSGEALARLPGELDRNQPKLLILCTGANDILRHLDLKLTADNLREMVKLAQGRGIGVMLIGVPHWGMGLQSTPLYAAIARELRVPLENRVFAKVLAQRELKSDPIHPNAAGYRKVAQAVAALITRSGGI
jgi:acyl-CoA thioesterase I